MPFDIRRGPSLNDNKHENQENEDLSVEPSTSEADAPTLPIMEQLKVAKAEIERLTDQSLRRQAELINYRRRVQKEQAGNATVAQVALLGGLVPVVDDLERAVETESKDAGTYHEGMQIILRSVQQVLEKTGVERIEPEGEAFDPRYHEAIARHETNDVPEGQVLEVCQPGYRLNDRLIRPAKVIVSFGNVPAEDDIGEDGPGEVLEVDAGVLAEENEANDG
ncbi:MAG: nucleotide exchange factor GrpE [Acidobacteria bacterium]|nr:nucleotide exchange factor GrpE [Acidobacteriota bacterium]